ncbi:MAG TPA: lipid-A-disaccharide synthase [Acidobacteriota bacterium]|nr:lipid-A-disaccharide synthase [Acidobacteriota bacterium]
MSKKQILIVAGEASADRYGARLVQRLNALHGADALYFYGTGGDEMQKAGVHLQCHIRDLAHIGVREAISGLRTYYKTYRNLIKESARRRPDLAVLLDFPDFNLRLAKRMKRLGIKVVYYISPQVWAWRSGRIRLIKEYVDKMLVILPFEESYYRSRGVDAEFVGHPLLEDFRANRDREAFLSTLGLDPLRKTVAILPGSRRKEIDYILPTLLRASRQLLKEMPAQFLISAAPTVEQSHIEGIAAEILPAELKSKYFRLLPQPSRDILANSDFAFVKSGTSSLEAALVGTPFLITYKISPMSWWIGSMLIRTPMKGLVNLIAEEKIVPELYQDEATPEALAQTAQEYLGSPERSRDMRERLAGIRDRLSIRCASETAAARVTGYL